MGEKRKTFVKLKHNNMHNPIEVLGVFVVLGTISYGIISIIKAFTDYKLKKRLIEKASANEGIGTALAESMKSLSGNAEKNKFPALKWGLICLFTGIGLMLIEVIDVNYRDSSLPYGILLTAVAVGFLSYFVWVKNEEKKA